MIFGIGPPDPDIPEPIGNGKTIAFILSFLIIFTSVLSILNFIKTGYQFSHKKILNNENRKKNITDISKYSSYLENMDENEKILGFRLFQ